MATVAAETKRLRDQQVLSSRLLFERRNWQFSILVAACVVMLACAPVLTLIRDGDGVPTVRGVVRFVAALCGPFFAVVMLIALLRDGFVKLCVHESGICHRKLGRFHCFPYEDLAALTYGYTRDDEGKIDADSVTITLEPAGAQRREHVTFSDRVGLGGRNMRAMRNAVARAMSDPLMQRLSAGERVSWTSRAAFEGCRLIYDFSSKPERSVSVADITSVGLEGELVRIYVAGEPRPLFTLDAAARNFYPGLDCLEYLRRLLDAPPLVRQMEDGQIVSL